MPHTAAGLSEWGRELDEWRAQGIELWAAISVLGQLQVVALPVHPDRDVADACPGIEPCAKRPESPVM